MTADVAGATEKQLLAGIGDRRIWSHFGLLVALATLLFVLGRLLSGGSVQGPLAALLGVPRFLFDVVPVAAAMAAGAAAFSRHSLRQARRIALLAPVVMVILESGLAPPAQRLLEPEGSAVETMASATGQEVGVNRIGSVQVLLGLLGEQGPDETRAVSDRYSVRDPRLLRTEALRRLITLLLPGVLIGLALGIAGWLNTRVRFVTAVDGRFAQLLVAWAVVPLAWAVVDAWMVVIRFSVLFEGASAALLFLPYVVFGVLAGLGWRSAARAAEALSC